MSAREINKKKKSTDWQRNLQSDLAGQEICAHSSIPVIRANLVVLAIGVVLAIVGVHTRLSRLKRMTPAIHKFAAKLDTANVTARRSASVGFCYSVEFGHVPVPPGV